ncbi:hypothetical protein [Parabacteroides sp. FAFU027]|uniref:hypothetical protein n=1 Tax=Parabacteroides sp. FAFU027 TaxID=2922715 RepID=UPI001FB037C3|nr:hypothetical protein [Parabacteroides sp. FAFU027]
MKKYGLISLCVISLVTLFAQKKLSIFKTDTSKLGVAIGAVDSITFSSDKTGMNIHNSDKSVTTLPVAAIDSITVNDVDPQDLPAVVTGTVSGVSYTTATCGMKQISTGASVVIEKGICWSTSQNPTMNDTKAITTQGTDSSTVSIASLTAGTKYYARAYASNAFGVTYGSQVSFTTSSYSLPVVETVSATYNYSTNKATCVVNVKSNGGCALTERGICWSTSPNPTIANSKYSSGITTGQFYAMMSNLSVNATYYVRSFATNCAGTSYGNQLVVRALMGNVTFTMGIDSTANPEPFRLIKAAMDSACYYYNRYTSFTANIYVYYNSGIPTAQASYHGSIGFGSNTTYMWVGTAMHEMAHYFGSGTTSVWQGKMVSNVWTGTNASTLLKTLTGETLKGDAMHFWPYGINYKSEITSLGDATAQKNGLIIHTKIVQAMCKLDCGL